MITVDQLEVLLRSIPQYFLFGALSLYLYAWIEKKPKIGLWAEVLFVLLAIAALITMMSGMIPSPKTEGLVQEHLEKLIRILSLMVFTGLLSAISISLRLIKKLAWKPLVLTIFAVGIYLFFIQTSMVKVKFELNVPAQSEQNK